MAKDHTGGNRHAPANPRWTYSTYRAALRLDGRIVALLTPDGVNSFDIEQVRPLINLLNGDEATTALLAKTLAQCASNKGVTAIDKAMQVQAEGNRIVHGETFATDAAAHMRKLNERHGSH